MNMIKEPSVMDKKPENTKISYPTCPANLSGALTSYYFEPKYIKAIRPLGDINPPGHTSPVDHATFMTDYTGKIPIYDTANATYHSEWDGKVLVQLLDNTHLKVEKKSGACTADEVYSDPYMFER